MKSLNTSNDRKRVYQSGRESILQIMSYISIYNVEQQLKSVAENYDNQKV